MEYVDGMNVHYYGLSSPTNVVDPFALAVADPSEANDKSKGCGIVRRSRHPFGKPRILIPDPGHSWLEVPYPGDATTPAHIDPMGWWPDGWRTPATSPSDPGDKGTNPKSIYTRPTRVRPDQPNIISPRGPSEGPRRYPGPPTPLCCGPGRGKFPSEANCDDIRKCLENYTGNNPYDLVVNNCHRGSCDALKACGLELDQPGGGCQP